MNNQFYYCISPELNSEINQWVIKYLIEIIGLVPIQKEHPDKSIHFHYGEVDLELVSDQTIVMSYHPTDLICDELLQENDGSDYDQLIDFDFVTAIRSFIND